MADVPRLVVHFGASWNERYDCEMQQRLEPFLARYNGRIGFAAANTDAEAFWPLLREWGVLSLPALVFLAHGRHVGTTNGLRTQHQLTALFDAFASDHDDAQE
jgi:thioredoxin-like negative regulator of GroEL